MAQDPSAPKDDGKVRLPRTDSAMNKVAPRASEGGKGGKKPETKEDRNAKILKRAMKRFERCARAEDENRKAMADDLNFLAGKQWPPDIEAQRATDKKPCLTINKTKTFVHQVTNDLRQNRPSINVSPVGDKGDGDVAKMYRGLIRAIERDCAADIAYDTAAQNEVANGLGYVRLDTDYESPDSFDQVAVIRRVRNPFTIYLDPDHQEPDGADAKYGFVTELIPRGEYEEMYPDAQPVAFDKMGRGEGGSQWSTQEHVRVAENYEVEQTERMLVALSNGHVGWEDDLVPDVKAQIADERIKVLNERPSKQRKVRWYKLTAVEIIDEEETIWDAVPIIKFIGDEIDIEGKVKLSGVVRDAKDPQRMYNYWRTKETEAVALVPLAPYIGAEGQFEGHESQWKQANTRSLPYLEYVPVSLNGKPAPPPTRQPFAGVPQGIVQAINGAAQDMMATTGIRFDATMGERMQDESGRAIRELRRNGDIGSFHYADNMARSLRRIGKMLVAAIPKIYDTKRILTILREDDTEERVQIDPNAQKPFAEVRPAPSQQQPNPKTLKIFNPKYGQYGVTVTIGPSYATKRIESSENMIAFAKAVPQIAPVIADLIAKNQDWPGADEIAKRLAKTLPANLLTPEQKDVPPQIQALIQKLGEQIQQLSQERTQLLKALSERESDRRQRQDEIDKAFEAKITATQEKFAEALLKVGAKSEEAATKAAMTAVKLFMDAAHQGEERELKGGLALLSAATTMAGKEQPPEPKATE